MEKIGLTIRKVAIPTHTQVWHYDRWSSVGGGGGCNNDAGNDDNNDSSDEPSLFGGYVDAFLKLKVGGCKSLPFCIESIINMNHTRALSRNR